MDRAQRIAEQLAKIYNVSGRVHITLDWNDNDMYVYRFEFTMYFMSTKIRMQVDLPAADVDFDKTLPKLVREATNIVQGQINFILS